jgi:hypothetical protein
MVEKSSVFQAVTQGRYGPQFRTNHFTSRELAALAPGAASPNSLERYARLEGEFDEPAAGDARDSYGRLRVLLGSHGRGGLCQHDKDGLSTQASIIASPAGGWIEICGGSPCNAEFRRFSM